MPDESTPEFPAVPSEVVDTTGAANPGADLGLGGLDLSSLLDMAGQMQEQMEQAHEKAAETIVEGSAGGGAVRVTVTGASDFQSVKISPDVVNDGDIDMLQDLILAALRDAMEQVQKLSSDSMGGIGGALPGLGDLGDLFG